MKIYLQDLVNRLSQFSEKLDNTTLFIDKPWVLVDSNSDYHKYIFKRDGELVMSLNGQVQIGKWEYLQAGKSILIDRIKDKILLNQSFFDCAVMVLKIDGSNNSLFILVNENVIPDLDVKKYLQAVAYKKFNVLTRQLENGRTLEIYRGVQKSPILIGMKATIDGNDPEDEKYVSARASLYYEIRKGEVFKITHPVNYKTNDGLLLTIEQTSMESISVGDLVYCNNEPAKTGKYKLGFLKAINVVNGTISRKSLF